MCKTFKHCNTCCWILGVESEYVFDHNDGIQEEHDVHGQYVPQEDVDVAKQLWKRSNQVANGSRDLDTEVPNDGATCVGGHKMVDKGPVNKAHNSIRSIHNLVNQGPKMISVCANYGDKKILH